MDNQQQSGFVVEDLAGYANGPDAPQRATEFALQKLESAEAAILVEGISDQIAIETIAIRLGRDLDAESVAVLPMGGVQAASMFMKELGPAGRGLRLAGFCDADGVDAFCLGLVRAGIGRPQTTADLADFGFYVCVDDLEDELIRAVGPDHVETVLEQQGELRSFRTFQQQREWGDRPIDDQLHRFLGTKSRRSLRYARLLMGRVELDRAPVPLCAALASV